MNREKMQRVIDRVLRTDAGGNMVVEMSDAPELNQDERLEVIGQIIRRHEDLCRDQVRRSARINPNSSQAYAQRKESND